MRENRTAGGFGPRAHSGVGLVLTIIAGLATSLLWQPAARGQAESESAAQEEAPAPGGAATATPDPIRDIDGAPYAVSSIDLAYGGFAEDVAGLPDLERVREAPVVLLETPDGFIAPRADHPGLPYSLDELFAGGEVVLYGSAIRQIGLAAAESVIRSAGVVGVYAVPALDQISASGEDLRDGSTGLTLQIRMGSVADVRTIASGDRVDFEDRENSDRHARIRRRSPVQPTVEGGPASFLYARALEDYLHRLNRHPGRRVELAVAPGQGQDEAVVDYLVYENRPWRLYAQISNTGTEATSEWRERFGFTHTQLTGRDDILTLEYATAGFDQTHALIAGYDTPIAGSERLRARANASWSEFTASDVGDNLQDFNGTGWEVNGDLVYTLVQRRDLFIDLFAGVRYFETDIDNTTSSIQGDETFFVPRVGLAAERYRDTSTFDASVTYEWSMPDVTSVDQAELNNLGRLEPDRDWQVLRAGAAYSFYLEPLLRDDFVQGRSTLAHELAVSARGQWAFDNRLIPVEQQVAGGLYSVRGYPESIASGDSVIIGSFEYRFHIPRALAPGMPRKDIMGDEFRWRPTAEGDRPDWDLIARSFVDIGRTVHSDRQTAFEFDETLIGAGVGLELLIRRNLSVRADWGIALRDMESGDVSAGSNRFHILATIVY